MVMCFKSESRVQNLDLSLITLTLDTNLRLLFPLL